MKRKIEKILYHSGDAFLPKKIIDYLDHIYISTPNKTFYINRWSFIHFFSGVLFGHLYFYLNYNPKQYYYKLLILHTIWELWQMLIGMSSPYKTSGYGNIFDVIFDTIYFMLGTFTIRNLV